MGKFYARKSHPVHGKRKTRIYSIWRGMKKRCACPNHTYYHCYGGRGISVCEEWKNSFIAFNDWAVRHGYSDDLTIDRIDNNGNYEPSNCRFIPQSEQAKNTRTNVSVTIDGVTRICSDWAKEIGITPQAFFCRLKMGITGEELLVASHQGDGVRGTDLTINGVTKSATKWAKEIGISHATLTFRLSKNVPIKMVFAPPNEFYEHDSGIIIDGITKTQTQWAREVGISPTTFHDRIKMGWVGNALLAPPNHKYCKYRTKCEFTINGETKTIGQWAKYIGISSGSFIKRITKGLIGDELLTPRQNNGHRCN